MIGVEHQHRGHSRAAMVRVVEDVRTRPSETKLLTTIVGREGSTRRFNEPLGLDSTGEHENGELVLRLASS